METHQAHGPTRRANTKAGASFKIEIAALVLTAGLSTVGLIATAPPAQAETVSQCDWCHMYCPLCCNACVPTESDCMWCTV